MVPAYLSPLVCLKQLILILLKNYKTAYCIASTTIKIEVEKIDGALNKQ